MRRLMTLVVLAVAAWMCPAVLAHGGTQMIEHVMWGEGQVNCTTQVGRTRMDINAISPNARLGGKPMFSLGAPEQMAGTAVGYTSKGVTVIFGSMAADAQVAEIRFYAPFSGHDIAMHIGIGGTYQQIRDSFGWDPIRTETRATDAEVSECMAPWVLYKFPSGSTWLFTPVGAPAGRPTEAVRFWFDRDGKVIMFSVFRTMQPQWVEPQ